MDGDDFAQRLDGVRKRFAGKLTSRISEIAAALPTLVGEGEDVAGAVYTAHRKVHDLCGIGPTLGFELTGKAARVCEKIMLPPSRGQRGLNEQEMARLKEGLAALQAAASTDMQSTGTLPE